MNSRSGGCNYIGSPQSCWGSLFAKLGGLSGLCLFLLLAASPHLASAANHGAGIFKNPLGPNLTPRAEVGQTITASIRVRNLDGFGDSLTITSIVDIVYHGAPAGIITSANLLPAPVTLTNFNDFVDVIHTYPVLPEDAALTNLLDNAIAGGIDNHDGPGGSHFPQNFQITFPGQIQMVTPCLRVTKTCAVATGQVTTITYIGSVSNCGNTILNNLVVSNFVDGAFMYVMGPISNFGTNQIITFTNSYRPNNPCAPTTDTLWAFATDEFGSNVLGSATATCAIVSTNPPTIACQPNKTVECGAPWVFDPPTVTSNGSGTNATVTVLTTVTNLMCGNTLTAIRTWLVTDSCGNTNSCSQTVTVRDTTPPTVTCAGPKTIECTLPWTFDAPTASDTCGTNSIAILTTVTNTTGFCGNTFSATRTWRATDACGNSANCSQTVTVVDTTAPVITCVPNKTVECTTAWTFDGPSASDTCGTNAISIVGTVTNTAGLCGNTFRATRTWRATDACGNTATCTQMVTVVDTTAPTITCVASKTAECTTAWTFDLPTASDTCGTNSISVVGTVTNAVGFCGNTFAATRTWRATDACGNSSTCTQMVTVVDTTAPTITCAPNKSVECTTVWNFDAPSANDTCGTATISIVGTITNSAGFCGNTFAATRTWRATDACGNSSTCTQLVTVVDTTAPGIACVASKTAECNSAWTFDAPTASDTCGTNAISIVSTLTNITGFCGNTFSATRTWRATDACGNTATCTQMVTVVDTTPPAIACLPGRTVECTAPWTFDTPTASDTCGTAAVNLVGTVTNTAGFCGNTFNATRTWRATDACGNSSTCTQMVTVVDTTAPIITCVASKTAECTAPWAFDAPTASDTCGTTAITVIGTLTNITGFCGNTFSATRTWRATDACGNSSTCTQMVTVVDTTAPLITCVASKTAECTTPWTFDAPTASDTCGAANISVVGTATNLTGFCGNTFAATRTWRATDACGNSSTCTQMVMVVDTTAPTITCAPNKSVECTTLWTFDAPTASDTCGTATISIVGTITNSAGFCGNTFAAIRTWRAMDACGNTATCTQMVTVVDTTPPTITCAPNKSVECTTLWTFDAPTASDTCGSATISIVGTLTNAAGFCGNTFAATRTWRATDACGNSSTCTQMVTVVDTTAPTITCAPAKSVECNSVWTFDAPTASDTCGAANISVTGTTTNVIGFCGNTFSATRTWRATDACGNIAACSQTVTVIDTTPPAIVCVPNKNVECTSLWTFDAPTASDTCGNAAVSVLGTVTNAVGFCGNTFAATRTWRATDACGNSSTCTQMVTVVDTTAPTITCAPNKMVECTVAWTFDAPTASDTCGGVSVSIVGTTTNINGFCGNTFSATRTWRATDACGNTAACSQTVTVVDTTPPVITCVGNKNVECTSAWTFDSPSASDTCGTVSVSIMGTTTNIIGFCGNTFSATRTWRATDACGNIATCSQTVTVIDTTPPAIVCMPNKNVECTSPWVFDAPTASDTCGNAAVSILGTVTNAVGFCGNTFAATRTWRATDACGNSSTCTQMVTVVDTTAPTITCAPNKMVECTAAWTFDAPTASDTCGGVSVSIVGTTTNINGFCGNTFSATRTWRATDACGNTAACSQTVTVVDTTPPVITCVGNKNVECTSAWTFDSPSASDTCGTVSVSIMGTTTNIIGFCGNTFSATRTWRATDACGNIATCSQTVTVVDTTPPAIVCVPNKSVECTSPWTFDAPTANDTCGNAAVSVLGTVTNAVGFCGNTFAATRTWRATDACGNSSTCTQMVTVVDRTAPTITCVANKAVECTATWTFDAPTASDTCGNATISIVGTVTNNAGFCGGTFAATRTWRATDACGNSSTCTQMVTVVDTTAPLITCAPNRSVECNSTWNFDQPTAGDTCGAASISIVGTLTNITGFCGNTFSATRTWRATDACGNSSTCTQLVTVVDTTAPVIVCVPNKSVECTSPWTFDAPTANDTCGTATISVVGTLTNAVGFCGNTFAATRTWRATDACGNSSTCTQMVTVVDTTVPTIVCAPPKTVECGTAWTFDAPTASDTCGGTTISNLGTMTNLLCGNTFSATRTWRATDSCGNIATCSQTVTVVDTTAPTMSCVANKTVECGAPWSFDAPSASDRCDGILAPRVFGTVTNLLCGNNMRATRTWMAVDGCGNSVTCTQMVTVADTTAPVITGVPPTRNFLCSSNVVLPTATATDICDPNPRLSFAATTNTGCPALIVCTWTATDCSSNSSTVTETITVQCCPPSICVTKEVACLLPGDQCGPFGKVASGIRTDSQLPAFCYRVCVQNCGSSTLRNLSVIDNQLGDITTNFFASPAATLIPGQSVCRFYRASWPDDTTNKVVVSGQAIDTGITVSTNDSAIARVQRVSMTCDLIAYAPDDQDNVANDNHVQLPSDGLSHAVFFRVIVHNTGEADLSHVTITDPTLLCTNLPVPFNLPRGRSVTQEVCGFMISCDATPFTNLTAVTATAGIDDCGTDVTGQPITARTACLAVVDCNATACRVTGGGKQYPPESLPSVSFVTHGGQVGAPVGTGTTFDPDSACIHGRWTHERHDKGGRAGAFQARSFDSLLCACLGGDGCTNAGVKIGQICNPGDRVCGPEPRKSPANKICFSGVGDYTADTGKKVARSVLFRIDLEDRSEPGGSHPGGATPPADRYRIRIWVLNSAELALLQNPADKLFGFRRAIAASIASTPVQDGAVDGAGHPISAALGTAVFGVRPPDIDDGGQLDDGNVQIHPQIKDCP